MALADIPQVTNAKEARKSFRNQAGAEVQVKVYVKKDLFHKRKFIIKQSELDFSLEPNSICFQCLSFCHMLGEGQEEFWDHWSSFVNSELNAKRNHVQNVAKDEYLSESTGGGQCKMGAAKTFYLN